jgi:murein tripeptide amidase MpaA
MTAQQEQELQNLDVEIQIAEKRLRIASIKKQIMETELDMMSLHRELQVRVDHEPAVAAA